MKIYALEFELEPGAPGGTYLIVWPDERGNGTYTMPAHPNKTLLDVRVGDVIIHKRRDRFTIKQLRPYRTSECRPGSDYEWLTTQSVRESFSLP